MTMYELLTFFEGYYGEKYSGVFQDTMTAYLDGCTSEFYLAIRKVMVLRFSRIYNKVPGPSEIEKYMDEINTVMANISNLLPEPEKQYATKEEAQEWLKEIKGMLSKGTGPMAGIIKKSMEDIS